jgi:hypothetical protein
VICLAIAFPPVLHAVSTIYLCLKWDLYDVALGLLFFALECWGEISEVNPDGDETACEKEVSFGDIGLFRKSAESWWE